MNLQPQDFTDVLTHDFPAFFPKQSPAGDWQPTGETGQDDLSVSGNGPQAVSENAARNARMESEW